MVQSSTTTDISIMVGLTYQSSPIAYKTLLLYAEQIVYNFYTEKSGMQKLRVVLNLPMEVEKYVCLISVSLVNEIQSPIFAGIVPEKSRTSVESLLASFTPSIVGALAQDFYGYRPIPKISSGSIEMETNRQNAAPLPGHCTQRLGFQWQSVASFTNSFSARIQETGREQGCMHYLSQKSCNK
ncbi:hypothetical protein QUC31_003481 [Theobroma cacao]